MKENRTGKNRYEESHMDKNRKIMISILAVLALSAVLATVNISITMQGPRRQGYPISTPQMGPGIGIVRVVGPIQFSEDVGEPLGGEQSAEYILSRLDMLGKDDRIKAILLRINSPGGTVAATQEIFQKLMYLRTKKNMVLVASMGDMAASGGYYLASACNYIIANHGTLTGSIGVIVVSPNLKGLFDKLGIKMNVIKSGRYKDILSSFRDIGDEERQLIQNVIDSTYQKFLRDVSLGRNIPISEIEPWADGRILHGGQAAEVKLIDSVGTFEDALAKARELAKLPEEAAVYDDIKSPFERLFMTMGSFLKKDDLTVLKRNRLHLIEYRYAP